MTDYLCKVYIVTGGTAGIGFGITAHLLQHNASRILLLSQKEEHADEAVEELKKYGDASKVHWVQCDLKDLKKTDQVAKQLTSEKQIDAVRRLPSTFPRRSVDTRRSSSAMLAKASERTMRQPMA